MLHTIMLLGTLAGILLAVGLFFGGIAGMAVALALSIAINFFSYWYSDRVVLRMYGAKPLENNAISGIVGKLAQEAKIPKPKLYVVNNRAANAFATGRDPKHSAIAVTEGLLGFNEEEIEGVLSHEVAHIANRDVLLSTMAAAIGGAIAFMAQFGYMMVFTRDDERNQGNIIGLILIMVFAPLAALLVRMAISRKGEYKADTTGALLTKNPKGLASALRKISAQARNEPMTTGSTATSHMWIVNPFRGDWFTGLFSTHPPIEKRIESLEEMRL